MADTPENLKKKVKEGGYDVGVVDNGAGLIIPPSHNGPNDGIQPGADLSKRTRITLGKYLSAVTSKNSFPVSDKATGETVPLTANDGQPAKLDQNPNAGGKVFVATGIPELAATSDAFTGFHTALKKGKQDGEFDGHTLLKDHVPDIKTRYTSAVLKSNRFKIDNQYRADLRDPGDSDSSLSYYARKKAGDTDHLDTAEPNASKAISSKNMQNVSKVLMLRATGELDANSRDYNPDGNIGALLPGASQLLPVQIINSRDLEARDVLEAMINEEVGSHTPGPDTSSWGALNNHLEPFTGVLPAGMIALCVALILATKIAFELLGLIMGLVPDKPRFAVDPQGIAAKGKFRFAGTEGGGLFGSGISLGGISDLQSLLGLRDTQYPYNDSFKEGMGVFFGKPPEGGGLLSSALSAIGNSFKKALESPGFYVIFCRSIIRSGYGIGKKLSEIGSNPLSIAQGIVNIIDDLRSSKIIAAFNMFAGLGDASFREQAANQQSLNQDEIPNDASAIYKSRLKGSRALAWRQASAASLYILPDNLAFQAALARGTGQKVIAQWDSSAADIEDKDPKRRTNVYYAETGQSRIPTKHVEKLEKTLDAEYVPFYFHDMRTNEIIQFRAFLSSLTEDYTPNWESIEAYGRVDPIRIYKNTTRRISLSFRIVSLDPNDFDDMWFKINKLVTLVYPQWSRGKRVSSTEDNLTFSQPFSQLISSSPLIRLRVGDLIKSNYSKFSLLRIFDFENGDGEANKIKNEAVAKIEEIRTAKAYMTGIATIGTMTDEHRKLIKSAIDSKTIQMEIKGNSRITINPPEAASLGGALAGAIGGALGKKDKKKTLEEQSSTSLKVKKILSATEKNLIVEVDDKEFEAAKGTNKIAVSYGPNLSIQFAEGIEKLLPKGNEASLMDNVNTFMDPETNPIVKYFENNMGRGLAGTIDSMNFAWLEENTWNVHDPGSQAPKSCMVTLSFTPIHDIAPGIDYTGFNRAPIYRVGSHVESVTQKDEFTAIKKNPTQPKPGDAGTTGPSLPKVPGL